MKDYCSKAFAIFDDETLTIDQDVCQVLGISNHKMAAQRLDGDEVSLADLTDSKVTKLYDLARLFDSDPFAQNRIYQWADELTRNGFIYDGDGHYLC